MSRFDYVKYDATAQAAQDAFKPRVQALEAMAEKLRPHNGALLAGLKGDAAIAQAEIMARTNGNVDKAVQALEEFYMWVGKAIKDGQIVRNGSAPLLEERKDG